jgi:hypothetical protein
MRSGLWSWMAIAFVGLLLAGCGSAKQTGRTTAHSPTPPPLQIFHGQALTLSSKVHLAARISSRSFPPSFVKRARLAVASEARRISWGRVAKVRCVGAVVLSGRAAGLGTEIRIRGALCNGVTGGCGVRKVGPACKSRFWRIRSDLLTQGVWDSTGDALGRGPHLQGL